MNPDWIYILYFFIIQYLSYKKTASGIMVNSSVGYTWSPVLAKHVGREECLLKIVGPDSKRREWEGEIRRSGRKALSGEMECVLSSKVCPSGRRSWSSKTEREKAKGCFSE